MILPDTSAWVEFDRATGSPVHRRVAELVRSERGLAVTEPVVMEVLAGARSEQRVVDLRRLLLRCHLLAFDAASDFEAGAQIYRRCRRTGVTPRGLVDCLVAAVAWRHSASVLATDADLLRIADIMDIDVDAASAS